MMGSLQQAEERAAQIAKAMVPVLTAEIIKQKPQLSPQEQQIMLACGELGRAVDRLDSVKYTPAETKARRALELAARNLRKLIDLREAKHARSK
ncbi:hypothetical protein [Mesorhizobium sp.]|uniref:hypothetical protein n=1 Tax=Mesorhizobium sp. TaxID=1871066 RepID=UPI000FE6AB76|nr:hypothetical protein [Mesorhizobium sp.]RWB50801.1 MAG: hypothetical protein EOQ47_32060 [Mesorhizobium sp.]